ncbi:MAG TPA: ABC transporter permease [Vicinamibacterales bacterium]|nr:ABC transporter permease [Vicinamibacterales bacterium]
MTRLFVLASRVRALFARGRQDEDFARELDVHLEMLADDYVRRGYPRAEAVRAARIALGGSMQLTEDRREQRGLPWLDTTLQDLRYGVRALRRNPVYALVAIATLAIGIGAGTTVFSLTRAVLLRPLPYAAPDRLVRIFETNPLKNWARNIAAPANYADWRRQNAVFTDIAAYEQFDSTGSGASDVFLTGFGEPQPLKALGVTGNLFSVLGARPLLGRVFTDEETYAGHSRVAILSYGAWQSIFGGDPSVVGRAVALSGRRVDVVGVMPRDFFFPGRDVQVWLTVGYDPSIFVKSRRPHWLGVVARLKPGVTLAQAQQDMNTVARGLERTYPDTNTQMGVRLENLHDSFAYAPRPALLMLSAAVALFFLIVCANVANLQLGRAAARAREIAVRRALGAARGRLVRQLFTESLLISSAGGAVGIAVAFAARAALLRLSASALPLFADVQFDTPVLMFAAALTLAAPVLFGVIPALQSSTADRLQERSDAGSRESRATSTLLIAGEVALSVVLVAAAILLARSLLRLRAVDPGFDPDGAVAFTVTLPSARYPDAQTRLNAFEEIERRLRAEPAVEAVGATSTLALRGFTWTGDATVEGRAATDYERELRHNSVTPGYFAAMRIRLIAGRLLDERDTTDRPPVAVVNESLARTYFHGADVVGRRITYGRPQDHSPWVTIVGVVADEQQDALDKAAQPAVYSSIRQQLQNPMTFVVRSTLDEGAMIAAARRAVHAVDPDVALTAMTSLRQLVDDSLGDHRLQTALLASFAGLALFLAALGVYGVLAYFVSQRSRELGIRLALGAKPRALFAMVVRQGMQPVLVGGAVGLIAAVGLTRLMATLLFGVGPLDPVSYASTVGALVTTGLIASALPARRATRVDPMTALRDE